MGVSCKCGDNARGLALIDELLHSLVNMRKAGRIHARRFGIGLVQGAAAGCRESKQGNTQEK